MNTKYFKQTAGFVAVSFLGACGGDATMNPVEARPPFKMSVSGGLLTIIQAWNVTITVSTSHHDCVGLIRSFVAERIARNALKSFKAGPMLSYTIFGFTLA